MARQNDSSLSPADAYRALVPASLEIRAVRSDEYARAGEVTALAYREFVRPERPGWVEYHERIADIAGRAPRMPVLIALVDGEIVGSSTIELDEHIERDWEKPVAADEAHLRMIGVHPDHRRRGIGRALVDASIALARDHGRSRITLETTETMVAAQRMYASMGFEFRGRRTVDVGLVFLSYELDLASRPRVGEAT